jgi:hypothetical protein
VAAFQNADVDELVAVLTEDAQFECHRSSHGFKEAQRSAHSLAHVCVPSATPQPSTSRPTGNPQLRCTRRPLMDSIACTLCMYSPFVPQGVGRVVAFMDFDTLRRFDLPHVLSPEAT